MICSRRRRTKSRIEHIYPQTETEAWKQPFKNFNKDERKAYSNSLGNLLLLSFAINLPLQNHSFAEKKEPRCNRDGSKLRNGYADGSHSEIEVARCEDWGPDQIRERGMRLLGFMEKRWDIRFGDNEEREKLLFIGSADRE